MKTAEVAEVKQILPAEAIRQRRQDTPGSALQATFPFTELPAIGTTLEVASGIRWLRMPLPFALDHINLWLLADGADWTAVDTGLATDVTKNAWREILPTHNLNRLIVTHFHPDHLGLAAWLQQATGASLSMSQGEYQAAQLIHAQVGPFSLQAMLAFFARHGLHDVMLNALAERGNAFRLGVPDIPPSYHRLRDGECMQIDGREWRVIVGYGHAPEHASLYCAPLGVLISGDMLLPKISTNVPVLAPMPNDNPLADFLDSIEQLTTLPDDTLVLPSHGLPFRGIRGRVAALQQHHRERCAAVLEACAAPKTAAELIPVLFDRPINDPHQCMFAMGEALAHLNYLQHQRRVRRIEENGISRFVTH
jgi:glyoxylase-like metal-dependent hydrolase (beta-lactamase superfamily II)